MTLDELRTKAPELASCIVAGNMEIGREVADRALVELDALIREARAAECRVTCVIVDRLIDGGVPWSCVQACADRTARILEGGA